MSAPASAPAIPMAGRRPLFGGYTLVALVGGWLAGIALRQTGPLATLDVSLWLALAALAASACVVAVTLGSIVAGRAPAFWRGMLLAALLLCAAMLGAARSAAADPANDPHALTHVVAFGATTHVRAQVATEPDLRSGYRLLTLDTQAVSLDGGKTWQSATGRIEADWYGADDWFAPDYGDTLELTGALAASGSASSPDVIARLDKAHGIITARDGGNPVFTWLFNVRVALAQALQHTLPEPEAGLLIGILLGLKTLSLRARLPLFTATGTIHLVVPAGLKVSLLATLASDALRPLGRWPRVAGSILAVGAYAALGGSGPPAVRAAIMGTLLVLAPALGRGYNVFTSLALAVLVMTTIEPLLLYDAGFQLTALATLGLPLFVPPIQARLTSLVRGLRIVPLPELVAELLAVTLAAQLATLPVLALTFHQISFVAPLANLLTVPLLAILLVLGGALALFALASASVPALGVVALALSWIVWPLLAYVDGVIALCAALPLAALTVGDLSPLFAWAYYAGLAGTLSIRSRLRSWLQAITHMAMPQPAPASAHAATVHHQLGRRVTFALLIVALLGGLGASAPALAEGSSAHLEFLDVGEGGEAALLRLPSGATALINGGPDGPTLESALATRLPFWQRSLDLAVLTDMRSGDSAGLEDVVGHYSLAYAVDAGMLHPTQQYLAWLDALQRAGDQHARIRAGNSLRLDASSALDVLAPPQQLYPPNEGDTTASNDLILRLTTPGLRALFLGSADAYALDALAGSGQTLDADVVELALVPGASIDLSGPMGEVLLAAHPRLVVVCDAPITPGSKTESTALASAQGLDDTQVATALGALIYRTSAAGTISLSGGPQGWTLGS